jgi:hypothetical protein
VTTQNPAQSELARLRQPRAASDSALHGMTQDYRGSVAGDFHNVLSCVGVGPSEVRNDHVIDHLAVVTDQLSDMGMPGVKACLGVAEPRQFQTDLAGASTGQAHYAQPAPARGGADSYDGVFRVRDRLRV